MAEKSPLCKHPGPCLHNSAKGFVRGAVLGLSLRAAIALVFGLIKGSLAKNPKSLLKIFASSNMKLVYFLSGMIGFHRSAICIARHYTKNEKLSSFIAGLASGVPLLVEEAETRMLFSMYLLVRAADTACRYLVSQELLPKVPKFIEFVYIFALSILIYAGVYHPDCTNKGFLALISKIITEPNDWVYYDMAGFKDKFFKGIN